MDLEGFMLSEINKTKKRQILYVDSKKENILVNITKTKQTHRYKEKLVVTNDEREGRRERWE